MTTNASTATAPITADSRPPMCRSESHCVTPQRTTPTILECSSSSLRLADMEMATTSSPDLRAFYRKEDRLSTMESRDEQQSQQMFTPYPFHQRSKEEIDDFNQLEMSFGEDWSLQFADPISCGESGMSVDTDDEVSFYGDDFSSPMEACPEVTFVETEELKSRRNQLWKESLKTSMFQRH